MVIAQQQALNSLRSFKDAADVVRQLEPGYPVFCYRPHELDRQARFFLDRFPGRVLYAVKCNPHFEILKTLVNAGVRHFDTASLNEIARIREFFPRADCYYMHPVKSRAALQSAYEVYRVDHYVIDHINELTKLVDVIGGGNAQVVIVRIATAPNDSVYDLASKFGATPDEAVDLLKRVDAEGFQTGIAFHVGSQCRSPQAYAGAVSLAGDIARRAGVDIHYLDVGGGFPANYVDDQPPPVDSYFQSIRDAMDEQNFRTDCVLMCEPGRAMVASACSLVVQVHLRKDNRLYINDGIYQSLSEAVQGGFHYPARLVPTVKRSGQGKLQDFQIFGTTCDNLDILPKPFSLPEDVDEGDWIEIGQLGAYSNSASTSFNGFTVDTLVTVEDEPLRPTPAPD